MKYNPLFKMLLVFIAIFSITACDNEPLEGEFGDGSTTNPPVESNFQVDVDGVTFVAPHAEAATTNGVTFIFATDSSTGTSVTILFTGDSVGTYSLVEQGSANYSTGIDPNPYTTILDGSTGEITITQYDVQNGLISGTFSFTASRYIDPMDETQGTETNVFTNGTFSNVSLQSDSQPETEGNFQVELDAELLVGETISATLNADGLLISATNGVQEIGFQIFDPVIGSFDLADETNGIVLYDPDNTNDESFTYLASEGTINITALDMANGTVSGDFSGVLAENFGSAEDIQMTNGIFENISFSTETPTDTATALINGEAFDATIFPIVYVSNTIQVTFSNDLDKSITLILPNEILNGTYPITTTPEVYSGKYILDLGAEDQVYNSLPGTGEIVITSSTNNILVGSFHFDAQDAAGDSVSITEGQFTIDIN